MKFSVSLLLLVLLGLSQAHPTIDDTDEEDSEEVEDEDPTMDITTGILTANNNTDENLLEGDLVLPKSRNAMRCWSNTCRWKKGSDGLVTIPYSIHEQFSRREVDKIMNAMKDFERKTCIRFVPHSNQRDYIRVVSKRGCYSTLGRRGGAQELSVNKQGCLYHGIIQHEFIHALGFQHEQTRSDRDKYVRILWSNINSAMQFNFQKQDTINLKTPYDYSSIMHYGVKAFTINGRETIQPIQQTNVRIGQRRAMSRWDITRIKQLYQC